MATKQLTPDVQPDVEHSDYPDAFHLRVDPVGNDRFDRSKGYTLAVDTDPEEPTTQWLTSDTWVKVRQ